VIVPQPSLMAPIMASASFESSPSGLKGLSYSEKRIGILMLILYSEKASAFILLKRQEKLITTVAFEYG